MSIGKNIVWGVKYGLVLAGVTSAWAAIPCLLDPKGVRAKYHVGFFGIVAMYMACGLVGGATLGVLRPLAKWQAGQAVISFLIGAICGTSFRFGINGFGPWTRSDSFATIFFGVLAVFANWRATKYRERKYGKTLNANR